MNIVQNPFVPIMGLTGAGLNGGKVYIGVANMDPETNPVAVYWDEALSIPASQPLQTAGGYLMRSGSPSQAYTAGAYSIRVRDRAGVQVFYEPDPTALLGDLLKVDGSNVEFDDFREAIGLSPTTVTLDVDKTGAADVTAAFNAAIVALQAAGGGTLLVPQGIYKISGGAVGVDGKRTGVLIPHQTFATEAFAQQRRVMIVGEAGTILVPGNNDVIVMRVCDQFSVVENISWQNPTNYTGCWAYGVVPADLTTTTDQKDTNWNRLRNFNIQGYAEGIVLQAGPTVGASSGCYYNQIMDGQINYCARSILIRDGVAGSQGANRNRFWGVRVGQFGNTGVEVQSGDTNRFIACDFEGVNTGTSPNVVPTAIKVWNSGAVSGWESAFTIFVGCTTEACNRDLDIGNDDTVFVECNFEFRDKAVYTQTPHFRSGKPYSADDYYWYLNGRGYILNILGSTLGVGTAFDIDGTPGATLDVHQLTGAAIARVKTDAGGEAEFRLDTAGNYGYVSFYQNGTLQWKMGTQLTGAENITFFDDADAPIFQIPQDGNGIRIYNSRTPASSAAPGNKGEICYDDSYIYVRGSTQWKRTALSTF